MIRRSLTKASTIRPEKKHQAASSGMPGIGGAGRESPIGDDDNEEVRQRAANSALNPVFRFHTKLSTTSHPDHIHRPTQSFMHLPNRQPSFPNLYHMLLKKAEHDLTSDDQLSDNQDFCSACGGSGFLLCCDGCDRSFHFSCLDPPLNDDASELNEPWFCFICVAKRPVTSGSPEKAQRGLFAPLLSSLKKSNPSNFALPVDIRDYFEGVATDRNGAFIEAIHPKTR